MPRVDSSSRGSRDSLPSSRSTSSTSRVRGRGATSFSREFQPLHHNSSAPNIPIKRHFDLYSKYVHRIEGTASASKDNRSSEFGRKYNHIRTSSPSRASSADHGYYVNSYWRNERHHHGGVNKKNAGTSPIPSQPASFDQERLENAAKREAKEQTRGGLKTRRGRGSVRGPHSNKTVRFSSPPAQSKLFDMARASPVPPENPFSSISNTSPFGAANIQSGSSFNPFAAPVNSFGTQSTGTYSARNPFGDVSQATRSDTSNPFSPTLATGELQTQSVFRGISRPNPPVKFSPFGSPSVSTNPSVSEGSASTTVSVTSNPFAPLAISSSSSKNIFGEPSRPASSPKSSNFGTSTPPVSFNSFGSTPSIGNRSFPRQEHASKMVTKIPSPTVNIASVRKNQLALQIERLLHQQGIIAPKWPSSTPGDPKQKSIVETFWHTTKAYRAKVRTCLMRNNLLDDPDKPKKLSEAIDFKGTCEEMCPEFERITRIMEHDVSPPEKEVSPDGRTMWPSLPKMVKKLARSAAGQDAPLPDDVRSPAALRRTLDYLVDTVFGDNDLESVQTFLWDRTRAIRRDFTFQQNSMSPEELGDQIYCLELIARFHVVSQHYMAQDKIVIPDDYTEQQNMEQLGKTLLSLIHAYEDCHTQGIYCENETEFKAYYILFNSHNTGILEAVQDWGYNVWGESNDIRTAVSLVETLQNLWDQSGPLTPASPTDIAQNAFHRFFVIVADPKISYTMACFAEIHFNAVRRAVLKSILAGYRKQRDQTKDWTLTELNKYLRFDHEKDIIRFGENLGLAFGGYKGEEYLELDSEFLKGDTMKQFHSMSIVERKRGNHTLRETMEQVVYENPSLVQHEENGMFVPESPAHPGSEQSRSKLTEAQDDITVPKSPFGLPPVTDSLTASGPSIWPDKLNKTSQLQLVQSSLKATSATERGPFTFAAPAQQAHISESIPGPSSKSLFENPTTSASPNNPFASLGQHPVAPSTAFNAPTISLFTPKEEIKYTDTPSAHGLLHNLSTATGSIAAPPEDVARKLQVLSTEGGSGKSLTPAGPFQARGQTRDNLPPTLANPPSTIPNPPAIYAAPQLQSSFKPQLATSSLGPPTDSRSLMKALESTSVGTVSVLAPPPKQPTGIGTFPEWVAGELGERHCLVDDFIRFTVLRILRDARDQFLVEREERKEQLALDEADEFRRRSLATRYLALWRKNTRLRWLRRKGRRARQLRREMAEERFRKAKAFKDQDVAKEFIRIQAASLLKKEDMLLETGISKAIHSPEVGVQSMVPETRNQSTGKSSTKFPDRMQRMNGMSSTRSQRRIQSPRTLLEVLSTNGNTVATHSQRRTHLPRTPRGMQSTNIDSILPSSHGQSQSPKTLRRSELGRSALMKYSPPRMLSLEERKAIMKAGLTAPGGSMIFHNPNWSPEEEDELRRKSQRSGVKTDYFRLKARGILTLPNGTPMASSAAAHLMSRKRSLDSSSQQTSPDTEKIGEQARNSKIAPSKIFSGILSRTSRPRIPDTGEDDRAIVARARAYMAKDKENKRRRSTDMDIEGLFARSKKLKEDMAEGEKWYRETRNSMTQSLSNSPS